MAETKDSLLDGVLAANAARLQGDEEAEATWEGDARPFIGTAAADFARTAAMCPNVSAPLHPFTAAVWALITTTARIS